ncbi:MAG: DUF4198 domain-containing protein [Pirellulales bacterium]|nr:DUF4198 domain-containing protein [Pirellulales bacterium]
MRLALSRRPVRRAVVPALATCLAAMGLATAPALAHQKWLWPNYFKVAKGPVWISFDVTWSDSPFSAEQGVGDQPLSIIDPAGERLAPHQVFVGKTKSTAEVELTRPGTYRLESTDPPAYWTRVEVDGQQLWRKKPRDEIRGEKVVRSDLYFSQAWAYVTLGEPSPLPPPDEKQPLEIIPGSHPAELYQGERLKLRTFSFGKPASRAKVSVFGPASNGHDPTRVLECDESGLAEFRLDDVGTHLFVCELEVETPDDPKAAIHSFNAYLTLRIEAKRE